VNFAAVKSAVPATMAAGERVTSEVAAEELGGVAVGALLTLGPTLGPTLGRALGKELGLFFVLVRLVGFALGDSFPFKSQVGREGAFVDLASPPDHESSSRQKRAGEKMPCEKRQMLAVHSCIKLIDRKNTSTRKLSQGASST
jgi:hypothetical protein